ncbi:MAG: AI-2E family transporter [Clostridia bacterium]|nr:AI-2E family transporter [Clostridia bacterium]
MGEIKNHWKKWVYWFMLAISIIFVYKAVDNFEKVLIDIKTFLKVLSPFIAGTFIAYILNVPCKKTEKAFQNSKIKIIKKKSKGLSIFTVYIIVALLIIILTNFILPVVIESIVDFINNIQIYVEIAINKYNQLPEDSVIKNKFAKDAIEVLENIDLRQYLQPEKILEYIKGAFGAVNLVFNIFVTIIVSIYILIEKTQIISFLKKFASAMFKTKTYKNIDKYFNNSNEIFFKFIASQFLDAIIVGVLVTIALSIMNVKYALLLGFMIGLFNMIPYFGAIIAVGIAGLITLITGGLTQAVWMLVVVIILQQIDSNIINPKIVGNSLKISPLLVIFAVTIGGAYFSVIGMFLAVPVIAIVKIVIEDYIEMKMTLKKKQTEIEK